LKHLQHLSPNIAEIEKENNQKNLQFFNKYLNKTNLKLSVNFDLSPYENIDSLKLGKKMLNNN
jgi:hypothetical protein